MKWANTNQKTQSRISTIFFDPINKVIILFALILATATHTIAADPPAEYCDDQVSWQQWQQLLADNPEDDGVASLLAFRIGLCTMVRTGKINTGRATKLFEQMRDAVVAGKLEEMDTGRVEL